MVALPAVLVGVKFKLSSLMMLALERELLAIESDGVAVGDTGIAGRAAVVEIQTAVVGDGRRYSRCCCR